MNCSRCAQPLVEGAAFCGQCGLPLQAQAAAVAIPAPASKNRRYALIAGGLAAVFFLILCNFVIAVTQVGSAVALVLSLIAAILPAVFYAFLVIQLDRYEREPVLVLLGAFLWGALVATVFSFIMNTLFGLIVGAVLGPQLGEVLGAGISAPIMEETSKGAAVLLLFFFLRDEFDNVLDGIVYGSLAGIGFAMTENIIYFGRAYQSGEILALGAIFYLRAVLGGLGHAAYTACTGAGFGFAAETKSKFWKIGAPVLGFLFAMGGHSAWNFIAATLIPSLIGDNMVFYLLIVAPLSGVIFTGPAVLALLAIGYFSLRRQARVVREQLLDEARAGVISMDEYDRLASAKKRLRAEWHMLVRRGVRRYHHLTQLHQAATELAFRKWHLAHCEALKRRQKQHTEDYYRRQIMELRARLVSS